MASRRRTITEYIIEQLKLINGGTSSFDSSYAYLTKLYNNVFRGLRFIDEINDFPSVYIQAGEEERFYQTNEFTLANLRLTLYIYVKAEDSEDKLENLIQDIEHVVYSLAPNPNLEIADVIIETMSTDEGLMRPFGIGEAIISISYQIE